MGLCLLRRCDTFVKLRWYSRVPTLRVVGGRGGVGRGRRRHAEGVRRLPPQLQEVPREAGVEEGAKVLLLT